MKTNCVKLNYVLLLVTALHLSSCKKDLLRDKDERTSNTPSSSLPEGPIIILKADDLRDYSSLTPKWIRFVNMVKMNGICASIGVTPKAENVLSTSAGSIAGLVTDLQPDLFPVIELWNHGYTHSADPTYFLATSQPVPADYDGDGQTDMSIYTTDGTWLIDYSGTQGLGIWDKAYYGYGNSTICKPAPADYDGDGKADLSVITIDGRWLVDVSSTKFGSWDDLYTINYNTDPTSLAEFASAIPVPANYNGTAVERAIYTVDGKWKIDGGSNGTWEQTFTGYGHASDCHPVPADYNSTADGKADLSIKSDNGNWLIDYSTNGFGTWDLVLSGYGDINAVPVPADYDNDGSTDLAVYDKTTYRWLIDLANTTSIATNNGTNFGFWEPALTIEFPSTTGTTTYPIPGTFLSDNNMIPSLVVDNKWLFKDAGNNWKDPLVHTRSEFSHLTSYTDQFNTISKTQDFFTESLELTSHAFGSTFNISSAHTNNALKQFSNDINVLMSLQSLEAQNDPYWKDPEHADILTTDKHILLDVDYFSYDNDFRSDYITNRYGVDKTKKYILIQIHPANWSETTIADTKYVDEFAEFQELITFYKNEGATFMTPYQYYYYLTHQQ